jgi:hypothetical protein
MELVMKLLFLLAIVIVATVAVAPAPPTEYYSIDGSGNNLKHPIRGVTGSLFSRAPFDAEYADDVSEPIDRINPR